MKSILQQSMLLLFILGLTSTMGFSQKKVANSQHKIVIQFSSGDTLAQKGLKNNLKNLTTAWPDASIEVVCHGPGISFVRTETTKYAEDIINFKKMGIVFAACENTLKERKIEKGLDGSDGFHVFRNQGRFGDYSSFDNMSDEAHP